VIFALAGRKYVPEASAAAKPQQTTENKVAGSGTDEKNMSSQEEATASTTYSAEPQEARSVDI
jgi:hypothetical protein